MKCDEYRAMVHEYMDGELPQNQAGDMREHTGECAGCAKLLSEYGKIERIMKDAMTVVPGTLDERVFQSIAADKRKAPESFLRKRVPAYYLIAASVVFVFLLSSAYWYLHKLGLERNYYKQTLEETTIRATEERLYHDHVYESVSPVKVKAFTNNPQIVNIKL